METITQSLARIEEQIYTFPYDADEYLQGVRDMMNLINGQEDNKEVADNILHIIALCKLNLKQG